MKNIPQIGLGTFEMFEKDILNETFSKLVDNYELNIDTAQFYNNEHIIGEVFNKYTDKRNKFWLTTKVNGQNISNRTTYESIIDSAKKLNTDYLDLVLLHTPDKDLNANVKAYNDLKRLQDDGIVKNIGVSNYSIKNLKELKKEVGEYPKYNQIMCTPTTRMSELETFCLENNIKLIGYSIIKLYVVTEKYWYQTPMNDQEKKIIDDLAAKYNVSFSALMHSWAIKLGYSVIPKSNKVERLLDIYDNIIDINEEDMKTMNDMNTWTDQMYEEVFN